MDAVCTSEIRGSFGALFCWSGEFTYDLLLFAITRFDKMVKNPLKIGRHVGFLDYKIIWSYGRSLCRPVLIFSIVLES